MYLYCVGEEHPRKEMIVVGEEITRRKNDCNFEEITRREIIAIIHK